MKVLALDFDGVICDSAGEVFQTALATWSETFPDSTLSDEFTKPETRKAFECLVPLGNRAEDFGVALHIVSAGLTIRTQTEYDGVRESLGTRWLERFHNAFYRTRDFLRTSDPQRWLGLHGVYPEFIEVLERHRQTTQYAVVTAKDGDSVRRLLSYFKIDDLFRDDLILDKETGIAKTSHIEELSGRLDCRPSDITFVDDKLNHLVTTASLGVKGVLAAWGHNTPRERVDAGFAGFEVATLENVDTVLFGS